VLFACPISVKMSSSCCVRVPKRESTKVSEQSRVDRLESLAVSIGFVINRRSRSVCYPFLMIQKRASQVMALRAHAICKSVRPSSKRRLRGYSNVTFVHLTISTLMSWLCAG